jgi:uncharacterized peroxidase-related enzyme
MSRLSIPAPEAAPEASRLLLDGVRKSLGTVPNLFRLAGQSPVALGALLGLSGAMARSFDPRTRERIALAVAEVNGCDYCLSAHTYLGLNLAGLDADEIALNRSGRSADPKADAAVAFAAQVARERGRVTDDDLAAVRGAGFSDAEIVEIVGHVVVNVFTNFLNNVAVTDIDFPVVRHAAAA